MTALHHRVTGDEDAPAVLMGGSLGTELEMWNPQLPLADRFQLICFDHRGHGGSPTPPEPYEIADLGRDVLELMDTLEIERAHFCGLSLGGMVGMWLGAHAPDRIDHLVLICTAAHMPPASAWQERAAAVRTAGSVQPVTEAVVERWLTPELAARHPEVRAWLRGMLANSPPRGYAACCGAIERMDLREDLARITVPTLVISGSDDLATPPDHQRLIAKAIPAAQHEIVGPAAHIAAVEQPEQINELIGAFLPWPASGDLARTGQDHPFRRMAVRRRAGRMARSGGPGLTRRNMRFLLNIIWLVLCGFWMALLYTLAGVVMCVLIITIPFGLQAFKLAGFMLWPFGRTVVRRQDAGGASLIGNVLWLVLVGWELAIGHLVTAFVLAITIIGIPLALANLKLVPISLLPFGRVVVPADEAAASGASFM